MAPGGIAPSGLGVGGGDSGSVKIELVQLEFFGGDSGDVVGWLVPGWLVAWRRRDCVGWFFGWLPVLLGFVGVPGVQLHNLCRWFLVVFLVPGHGVPVYILKGIQLMESSDTYSVDGVPSWLLDRGISSLRPWFRDNSVSALLPVGVIGTDGEPAQIMIRVKVVNIWYGRDVFAEIETDALADVARFHVEALSLTGWRVSSVPIEDDGKEWHGAPVRLGGSNE